MAFIYRYNKNQLYEWLYVHLLLFASLDYESWIEYVEDRILQ